MYGFIQNRIKLRSIHVASTGIWSLQMVSEPGCNFIWLSEFWVVFLVRLIMHSEWEFAGWCFQYFGIDLLQFDMIKCKSSHVNLCPELGLNLVKNYTNLGEIGEELQLEIEEQSVGRGVALRCKWKKDACQRIIRSLPVGCTVRFSWSVCMSSWCDHPFGGPYHESWNNANSKNG